MRSEEDSLHKRYGFKLMANLIGFVLNLAAQAIIPRGLGPKAYGDFNFLSDFFTQIQGFLDMGTSICFYTKLSQRPKEFTLVSFYLWFCLIASVVVFSFVFFADHLSLSSFLWPGQETRYILLAAVWGLLTWITQVFQKMSDAYGLTVSAEKIRILQRTLGLMVLIFLYFSGCFNLTSFFLYQYLVIGFFSLGLLYVMDERGFSLRQSWKLGKIQIREYTSEFVGFCHPLVLYSFIGLIVGILDRWLLQIFAGSVQQGFFGLSYQIGAICFLFTRAMTPLLTREFAIAFEKNDLDKMAALFRRYIPLLYSIAAFFACFILVQADKVIAIIGGNAYSGALLPVMLMSLYPIHQTYGQLSGSVFYATGQTRLYRNIGVFFMLIGVPLTYLFIAPPKWFGFGLGSTGLALKMILQQFLGVNVQLYFNAKFLGLSFMFFLKHQILSIGMFVFTALLSSAVVSQVVFLKEILLVNFVSSGILYSLLVLLMFLKFPEIFGLNVQDVEKTKILVLKRFH